MSVPKPLTIFLPCLNLHHEQGAIMTEKRSDKREDLMQVVNYAPSPYSSSTVLRGLIKDWSFSGLCLIAREPIDEGQEIIVNSVVVPKSKNAVVRWFQNLGNGTYKIGLEIRR
jgi:hypothetical protein